FLTVLGGIWIAGGSVHLNSGLAMSIHVGAAAVAFCYGSALLLRELPSAVSEAKPAYQMKNWIGSIMPLSMLGGIQTISGQADVIVLGLLRSSGEVGVYRVALQLSAFVMVAGSILNAATSPHLARMSA